MQHLYNYRYNLTLHFPNVPVLFRQPSIKARHRAHVKGTSTDLEEWLKSAFLIPLPSMALTDWKKYDCNGGSGSSPNNSQRWLTALSGAFHEAGHDQERRGASILSSSLGGSLFDDCSGLRRQAWPRAITCKKAIWNQSEDQHQVLLIQASCR